MSDLRQNGQIPRTIWALIALVFILGISILVLVARQSPSPKPKQSVIIENSETDPIRAIVDSETISEQDLVFAMSQWNIDTSGENVLTRDQALERLIQQKLFVKLGRELGIENNAETQTRINFMRDQILAEDSVKAFLDTAVSDQDIQQYYDSERRIRAEQIQVKARQIVTPDEATAMEIVRRLDKGEAFATLALAFSLDRASREAGGDLGYINYDMLDPLLSEKIFAATDGARLDPFATPQGWHVVEVISRRKAPIPSLESRRDAIIALLKAKNLETRLSELQQKSDIQILTE